MLVDLSVTSFEDLSKLMETRADTTIKWALGFIECAIEELEEERDKFDEDQDNRIKRLNLAKEILIATETLPLWSPARKVAQIGYVIDFCDEMIATLEETAQKYTKSLGLTVDDPTVDHREYVYERSMKDMEILKQTLLTEPDDPYLMT